MVLFLYAIFILSGAAGLIYESIWTRYLGLFVGHSAYAQVLVLVIFLGGMSVGALIVGRRSERLTRPLFWYAMVELATGVIGLVFHDVYVATTALAYDRIFPALGVGAVQTIVQWSIAALLILPQSVLLGMTFPLMSAGVVRRIPAQAGRALSMLYFANSLGAAISVLAGGFWLVAVSGLPGTLLVAAMINIAVAGAVVVALRVREGGATEHQLSPVANQVDATRGGLWRLLLAVSFGTALSSFIYEIGWIRMLALVLGSATHSFELMLSAFILGLALGAFWVRRRADTQANSLVLLGVVQLAMGSLAIMTLPVYLASFDWMADLMAAFAKTPQGYSLFSVARYVLCLAVMLPATFCAGMTLPLITRALVGAGVGERAIGQVYSVNTFGSIVGAAIAGLVMMPLLGLKWLLIAGASVDLALGIVLLARDRNRLFTAERARRTPRLIAAGAVVALLIAIVARTTLDHTLLTSGVYRFGGVPKAGSSDVLFYRDGRTATVSVRRIPETGGLTLATNGKPDASMGPEWLKPAAVWRPGPFTHDAPTQFFIPLMALAHVPRAKEAAVIGHGSGMTSHALLGSPYLQHLVTIEIEPQMIEASRAFLPANARVFNDPRSRFAIDDARAYFAARGQKYDLIVSEPSNPWVSGVSGLFTVEFYSRVKQYLTPDGVFAQWLHLYEIDDGLVLSVIAAVAQQFPSYSIYQTSSRDILIVATQRDRLPTPDWSILNYTGVAEDLRRVWPVTPATMEALHLADSRSLAPLVRMAGVANSDFYPTLDLNAERTRFMRSTANGMSLLSSGRVNVPAIVDGRRNAPGDSYAVVTGVSRLDAMADAAAARNGDPRAGQSARAVAARWQLLRDQMATQRPPRDWREWVQSIAWVEGALHGAMAGVADSSFYNEVRRYLAATNAPPLPRAAVEFLHGLAVWDFAEAARSADPLMQAAAAGDLWLDPDELRDGVVMARLLTGNRAGARDAFQALVSRSARDITDLRTRLLYSYIADTTEGRLAAR